MSRTSHRAVRRASPLAVVGAFGLVGLAIFFGLLGPQIQNRGNVVMGPSLDELLLGSLGYYDRERLELRMIAMAPDIDPDDVRSELLRRFDERASYLDLATSGYSPFQLETFDSMGRAEENVVVVLYGKGARRPGDGMVAALLYIDESQRRIAEDRFGVPMVMEPGVVYRSRVGSSEPGRDAWSASWYEGAMLHVLLAESFEQLEALLGSINESIPEDSASTDPVGSLARSGLDPVRLQDRLS